MRDEVRDWLNVHISNFLQSFPVTIVSGGAQGVDQLAHSLALRNQCPTIVFLPSGHKCYYPKDLQIWEARIIDGGGAIVSEFPPMAAMRKYHFARRNRLIAAMGDLVFIAQAARSSGTQVTALHAVNLGRPVGVLPHFPGNEVMGSLELLRDGALMIQDSDDLLTAFHSLRPVLDKTPNRSN
jgi:DNA processing protein